MEPHLSAPTIIQYLPTWDGSPHAPWTSVRAYFASKPCAHCGSEVRPMKVRGPKGNMIYEAEMLYNKRQCCGKSCAKKLKNPMHSAETRAKVSAALKAMGHRPATRGGNGTAPTSIQRIVHEKLGADWVMELAVKTRRKRSDGYPYHYKLDLANLMTLTCIELDGGSHGLLARQQQDRKKDALLRSLGWKVLRLSNAQASDLFTTSESPDIHRILQMAS